jgi:hypothetical protein
MAERSDDRSNNDVAGRVFEVLLRKVEQDHYPSNQQLDLLEQHATEEQRRELVAVLADKITQDRYPSMQMIRRMLRLANQ